MVPKDTTSAVGAGTEAAAAGVKAAVAGAETTAAAEVGAGAAFDSLVIEVLAFFSTIGGAGGVGDTFLARFGGGTYSSSFSSSSFLK
jgi:hypothetical protein